MRRHALHPRLRPPRRAARARRDMRRPSDLRRDRAATAQRSGRRPLRSWSGSPNTHGLFWKIEKSGIRPLLAARDHAHTRPEVTTNFRPAVIEAFERAGVVVLEIEDVSDEGKQALAEKVLAVAQLPEGETFDRSFHQRAEGYVRGHDRGDRDALLRRSPDAAMAPGNLAGDAALRARRNATRRRRRGREAAEAGGRGRQACGGPRDGRRASHRSCEPGGGGRPRANCWSSSAWAPARLPISLQLRSNPTSRNSPPSRWRLC